MGNLHMSNYGIITSILRNKSNDVWTVDLNTTVFAAISLMAEKNIGALIVMDDGKPAGIFSERDYARKVDLAGKSSKRVKVHEIISNELITITPRHTVEECMRLMSKNRIRHLPVMDEGRLAGVVSIGDLVSWVISAQTETIHQLENYISGGYPT
jgi:CBS domain-containing protein